MKKFLIFLLFSAVLSGAFAAGVALELDARGSKVKLGNTGGLSFRNTLGSKTANREFYLEAYSKENAPLSWTAYSISFTPEKSGYVTLGLSATYVKDAKIHWIDYDKLEIINAKIDNPSFEQLSWKKEFFHWRYYTKQSFLADQKDAADGKNYVRVSRSYPARQSIAVTAGKKVTIKFMARSGGATVRPTDKSYRSDQTAPLVKPQKTAAPAVSDNNKPNFRIAFRGEPFFNVAMSKVSVSGNAVTTRPLVKGKPTPYHVYILSKTQLSEKWQKYTITFTPSLTGEINMYVEGTQRVGRNGSWVFFDKFEAKGTKILNPSFEQVNAGTFARWMSYPHNVRTGVAGAPNGKTVAAVCYESVMRQVISVVKNRPVTISFYAKKGDTAKLENYERSAKVPNNYPVKYYRFYDKKKAKYLPLENKGVPGEAVKPLYPWIKLSPPPAVTIQYPVKSERPGKMRKGAISFELLEESGIARSVFVKHGFPFKRGDLFTIDKLSVLSPAGKAVPAQFTAISFWPDKSIKFVLAEFKANLKAKEKSKWSLCVNSGKTAPALPVLKCMMTGDGFEVDTGRLQANISKNNFNFLRNIKVDGKVTGSFDAKGLVIADEQKKLYSSSDVPLKKLYVESNGPLAVTLRAEGEIENDMGRFTCRMTFRAGSPVVDFSIRYQNIKLKTEFNDIRSLKFAYAPKKAVKKLRMEGVNCRRIFQHNDEKLQVDGRYFNRMMGDGGSAGNITYALKDTAERYPKAFSVADGKLNFELLPEQPDANFGKELPFYLNFVFCGGLYRMKWGMGFTEDLKIDFSGKTSPAELAAKSVVPVIDTAYLYQTRVFPGIPNGKNNPFAGLDAKAVEAFYRHMDMKAKQREYGFLNWGDWYGERGRNWTNNEYDFAHGLFMLYLRTGNRDAFRWAMTAARHQADVDIVHAYPDPAFVGANVQHSIGHTGQSSSSSSPAVWSTVYGSGSSMGWNGHTWSEGMTEAWLLGGDEISMESALLLGEHLVTFVAPQLKRLSTHERSAGWSIPALLGIYRATGNRKYLNAAGLLVGVILDEQKFELGGAWPHKLPSDHANGYKDTYGNCPYLVGIVLHALQKYNEEQPSKAVQRSIIAAANWLYRGLDKNRIGWSYGMNYDGKNFWLANQGLNLIIAPGMMTGGRLANDRKIYDSCLLITSCSIMTGVSHVGKSLSIRLCMLPVLFEEMNRFSLRNPKAGKYKFMPEELTNKFGKGLNDRFRMRGPDNMAFEVVAKKPSEIEISRFAAGSNPNTKPEFNFKVIDKNNKVISSGKGKIRAKGSWKVKLPAKGRYMVEIQDSCTGVWDVTGKNCRIRTELRKGYLFVNGGISNQLLMIPAGTKEFTLEFFGTHEGGCNIFLLDPRGRVAGSGSVVTAGTPRLPWFKGAETLPKGKIKVRISKPYKKETAWKIVSFAGGGVRLDLKGAKGQIALSYK